MIRDNKMTNISLRKKNSKKKKFYFYKYKKNTKLSYSNP